MVDGRPITAPYEFLVIGVAAGHGDGDEHPRRRRRRTSTGRAARSTIAPVRRGRRRRVAAARHASIRFARRPTTDDGTPLPPRPDPGDDRRMATPDDRRYTDQHEWALVQGTDGTATVVRVGHHRPRAGRAGRHRLRAAARGGRRGRPRRRRSARSSRPSRCPTSTPRSPASWPPSTRRWPTRRRPSTPIPYGAGWLVEISVAGEGGDPIGAPARRRRLPGAGRRVLTGPPPGPGGDGDHYDRAGRRHPGDQPGTAGSAPCTSG